MSIFSTVQVKDGSGSWQETLDGVDVTPGNTISIRLKDSTGVSDWYLRTLGTDEESTIPALTDVNPGTHLVLSPTTEVTFTVPSGVAGRAYGFHSRVDGTDPTHVSKFAVFTLTANSDRVGFVGMTHEGDPNFGWTQLVNKLIRNAGGGGGGGGDATSIQGTPVAVTAPTSGQGLSFNGTDYTPTDLARVFAQADNSSGARAVLSRRANLMGGRSWSEGFQYYIGRNVGASATIRSLSSDSITSPSTGPNNIPAAMASCLLGDELFFTGTWSGQDGWLWSYNINEGTSRRWIQLATSNATRPSGGTITGMNCTDLIAHTDWLGANFIAGVQPNGFFMVEIFRAATNPMTGDPFYEKAAPDTANGFLGGRIAVSMKGQTSTNKYGQILVTAPNENAIYLYDWNGNGYAKQAFPGSQPTAICADGEENVWVCDTTGGKVYRLVVDPNLPQFTNGGFVAINDPRDVIFDGRHILVMSVADNTFYRVDPKRMVVDATLAANGADSDFGLYGGLLNADWTRMVWDGESVWFRSTTRDMGHFDPASMTYLGVPDYLPGRSILAAITPGVMVFWAGEGVPTLQFTCTNMGGNQAFNSISWLDRPLDVELGGGTSNEYIQTTSGVVNGIVNTTPQVIGFARLVHPSNGATQSHKIAKKGRRYRRVRFRGEGHCTATGTLTIKIYDFNGVSGTVGYLASATRTLTAVGGYVGGPVSIFDVELTELTTWINTLAPAVTSGLFEVVAYVDAAGANAQIYRTDLVVSWETA